jgi:hypothetical protein
VGIVLLLVWKEEREKKRSMATEEAGRALATKAKLVAAVLVLELLVAGFHVVSRAALDMGVSKMAFLVYRNAAALLVVAPVAYFLDK